MRRYVLVCAQPPGFGGQAVLSIVENSQAGVSAILLLPLARLKQLQEVLKQCANGKEVLQAIEQHQHNFAFLDVKILD